MKRPALPGAAGGAQIIRKTLATTTPAPVLQGLRCTACGSEGRIPTIAIPPDDPQPALRLTFLSDGPGLLCAPGWAGMNAVSTACRKTARPRGYIENYRPQKKTAALLEDADAVLREYHEHWPLTCRQIYYRLVGARGYPKTEAFYDSLCHHLANARRARVIPFSAVRDDGITTVDMQHFDDEEHFKRHLRELAERYTRNKLAGQDLHIEAHCEASGMIFQLAGVAHEYSVEVYSSSGFDSLTAKKHLADRICRIGKRAVILHLGDFDPSGESIFESAAEDVQAFVKTDWPGIQVEFRRVALTAAQVKEYELPTAPPKATDSRSRSWTGETCQLEALPPDDIADLLRSAIEDVISPTRFEIDRQIEALERRRIALALPAPRP